MRVSWRLFFSVLLSGLLGAASPVSGQAETTGSVLGSVKDANGAPIADAKVAFLSPALQSNRVTRTDNAGRFLAALLPPGPYAVTVTSPGKQPKQVSFRVQVGQTEPLSIAMVDGENLVETVTVTAPRTPLLTTALGDNFQYDDQVELLPIPDRRIENVARLAANTTASDLVGFEAGTSRFISIAGAPYYDTAVLLDGAEISESRQLRIPTLYLEDSIAEVQVQSAGISSRYGRFRGGVINAVTKFGGNQFEGSLRAEFSNDNWNSATPFGEPLADDIEEVYQATLGGYMLRDKLWFFVGARVTPTEQFSGLTRTTAQPIVEEADEERFQVKLRASPHPNHVVEASYLDFERVIAPLGVTLSAGARAGDLGATRGSGRLPRSVATLAYQYAGKRFFVDLAATTKDNATVRGGDPGGLSPLFDGATLTAYANALNDPTVESRRDNNTIGVSVTTLLTTQWGTHMLESGLQYVESTTSGDNRRSPTGLTFIHGGGATPFAEAGPTPGEVLFNVNATDQFNLRWVDLPFIGNQVLENTALYVNDSWDLHRWRFDLGLRWENYEGRATQPSFDLDTDVLAPRVGVTYDASRAIQVQATWGRYYGRILDGYLNLATGVGTGPFVQSFYTGPTLEGVSAQTLDEVLRDDSNWGVVSLVSNPNTPVTFVAPGIEPPHADDLNLAIRWDVPGGAGTLTLAYTLRDFDNVLEAFVGDFGTVDVPVPGAASTQPFDAIVWDNAEEARQRYKAVTTIWNYRPGANWGIGGNYTYSESTGNVDEINANLDTLGTALGTYERSRAPSAVRSGFLANDVRHRMSAWADYLLPTPGRGMLVLGGLLSYQSGLPWSRTASLRFSADPDYVNELANTYRNFFGGRGAERFDDWWSLDLSTRYQFRLYKSLDAWAKIAVINALDQDELVSFDTSASAADAAPEDWTPSPLFGSARGPEDFQRPRSFLLTLGLRF